MTMTDPIADMLTRIRNALLRKKEDVIIPLSTMKQGITEILKRKGRIRGFEIVGEGHRQWIRIYLRYTTKGGPMINGLRRVSKPGRRVYRKADTIPKVRNGLGIGVISTSKGLLTDAEARERHIGGEYVCEIW